MAIFKNPNMDLQKDVDVKFVGEMGTDLGGPKREFFSHIMHSFSKVDEAYNIQILGGQDGHLIPLSGGYSVTEGYFEMVGKFIAWSVLHGGDGLVGLSRAVVEYLSTGSIEKASKKVHIKDLYDIELRTILEDKVSWYCNVCIQKLTY